MADSDRGYARRLGVSLLLTEDHVDTAGVPLHPEELGPTAFPEERPAMEDAYREMLALCREKG